MLFTMVWDSNWRSSSVSAHTSNRAHPPFLSFSSQDLASTIWLGAQFLRLESILLIQATQPIVGMSTRIEARNLDAPASPEVLFSILASSLKTLLCHRRLANSFQICTPSGIRAKANRHRDCFIDALVRIFKPTNMAKKSGLTGPKMVLKPAHPPAPTMALIKS